MNEFIEPGISLIALAAVFYGGIMGAREGLFRTFARFCFGLLAFIVALRWWYPGTSQLAERFSVAPEQVSFTVFWGVYALLILPFLAGLKTLNHDFIPAYPIAVERAVGFIFGAANMAIIAAAVLLSFTLNFPKVLPAYDESKLLVPIHRLPSLLYRKVETGLAHTPLTSPSHTMIPSLKRATREAKLEVHWE